jgi:phenylalanyl-tRNA synthetase beta chain
MNVPLSWLADFLPELPPLEELTDLMAGLGLGVERVFTLPGAPQGVVVARVERLTPVAGSDYLRLAEVSDGNGIYKVVTGAPNARAGMLTALAPPGTVLPVVGLTVSEREMAGVRSEGVLCSPRELGLFDYAAGLGDFGDDARLGQALAELWPDETVIELELSPNRGDAFSLLGVARDLAAKLGVACRHPAEGLPLGDESLDTGLRIEVEDARACPRFTLRLIDGVTVKPSPIWLQRRLAAVGVRPRNNVVDVTNYVTFELGQPAHAYDKADLVHGTIVVRRARPGESLLALDEVAYDFTSDDLLITTPTPQTPPNPPSGGGETARSGGLGGVIGVAGVIGGLEHSVKEETSAVVLEVAHFDPVVVRRTAKRLGISTAASYRFERGVDPNLPPVAAARAASLIADISGGKLHPGLVQVGGDVAKRRIDFRPSRVPVLMAFEVPVFAQRRYLEALSCEVEVVKEDLWRVAAPTWRFDLAIEEDLVEEVGRLHGYEHIPTTIPTMPFVPEGKDVTHRGLRALLVGFGLQETINYTFTSDETLAGAAAPASPVRLLSPPSAERSVLRTALYPGLLEAARTNRHAGSLALFEIGHVFNEPSEKSDQENDNEEESERLGILLGGDWVSGSWLPDQKVDFYVAKGLLEKLARTYGVGLELVPKAFPSLHPGISAEVYWSGKEVGWLGKLHPRVARHWELGDVYIAELELPLEAAPIDFKDFSRQPYAERDLAVVAPLEVTYAAIADLVEEAAGPRLASLEPFDVYVGQPIPEGRRSIALRLRFRDSQRALRDEEVDGYMTPVIAAVKAAGYTVREG